LGDVVTALDVREERDVVLKRVKEPSRSATTRLRTVHRVLTGLQHPSVMRVLEILEARADSWLVSEQVPGPTLPEYWATLPLPPSPRFEDRWHFAAPVVASLLDGLEALHRAQLAHLDVKPSNIRIDRVGRAVLVDVGLGAPPPDGGDEAGPQTSDTPWEPDRAGWQAPELLDGIAIGRSADQWSLGAVLYFLLTGRKPIASETAADLRHAYEIGRVQPMREWRPDIPAELDDLALQLLAWDPERRFASIGAVRHAFGERLEAAPSDPLLPWSVREPPMVGREALATFLRRRLLELKSGRGSVICVQAEPGGGKTRLLRAWAEQARAEGGVSVYEAGCLPISALPLLSGWFRPPPCDVQQPPPKNLVEQALQSLPGPALILLDAIEAVDAVAWARVHRVAAAAALGTSPHPLVLALAGRALPDLAPRVPADNPRVFRVELPPLQATEVGALLRPESASAEDGEVRDHAAAVLCESSRGNPLKLLEELLNEEREGRLRRDGRHWVPRVGAASEAPPLGPPPPALPLVFGWLAELGGHVELDLLVGVIRLPRQTILDVLRWATAQELLRFRAFGTQIWVEAVQRQAPDSVQLHDRPDAHAHAALWIECNSKDAAAHGERIAQHYRQASLPARAVDAYAAAASAHAAAGNTPDARRLQQLAKSFLARRK
jgi:hypothetical protein